jgi:hypothetical protein
MIVLDPAPDFWLNHFGESTGPFRILMTEQHFAWLNVQCKEMTVTKKDSSLTHCRNGFTKPAAKTTNVGLSWLIFQALTILSGGIVANFTGRWRRKGPVAFGVRAPGPARYYKYRVNPVIRS